MAERHDKPRVNRRETLIGSAAIAALPLLGGESRAAATAAVAIARDQPFDFDWKFFRGAGQGFEAAAFDDSGWRSLDLPHDWSIEDLAPGGGRIGPFDPKAESAGATGYAVGGEGWYRKHFRVDALPARGRAELRFGGVYTECELWLNGQRIGEHVHGYTPFVIELTPYLRRGADNVLAVRVRNLGKNSRWYSGSGIYRSVTLDLFPEAARIAPWGIAVNTPRITDDAAEIAIATTIEQPAGLSLVSRIRDDRGRTVAEATVAAAALAEQRLRIAAARLWSPDSPTLYRLESELRRGDRIVDRVVTPFGVRIVSFDPDRGMRINGVPTKLRGGCIHHDNGLLGAAAFADAEARKVRLLKARGYNAIRSSHNPTSDALRAACDRLGMLLIEEAFDMWQAGKNPDDYSTQFRTHWRDDLTAMVLSARNSPSVILWSIGNEVPARSTPEGVKWQWTLANTVRRLDPTRPVTAAVNSFAGRQLIADAATARPGFAGVPDESASLFLDVVGYNYKLDLYAADHAKFPRRIIYGSESFPKDVFAIWDFADKHPFLVGDFVWTAMDYIGEAGIGGSIRNATPGGPPMVLNPFPFVGAYCGDLDLIGQQKPQSLARDVAWGLSPVELTVLRPLAAGSYEHFSKWGWPDELASWTWPGAEGRPLSVRIYSKAERVELRLNGKTIAARAVGSPETLPLMIDVPYAPGTLEAIAWRGGREVGRRVLRTTGAAAAIRLTPEQPLAAARRNGLSYVAVEIVDAAGALVPDASLRVGLEVSGPVSVAGFGNGGPNATGSFQSNAAQTYRGRALVILRSRGQPGTVSLRASAGGLMPGVATIRLAPLEA